MVLHKRLHREVRELLAPVIELCRDEEHLPKRFEVWLRAWFMTSRLSPILATAQVSDLDHPLPLQGLTFFRDAEQLVAANPKHYELFLVLRHSIDGVMAYTYLLPDDEDEDGAPASWQILTVPGDHPDAVKNLLTVETEDLADWADDDAG